MFGDGCRWLKGLISSLAEVFYVLHGEKKKKQTKKEELLHKLPLEANFSLTVFPVCSAPKGLVYTDSNQACLLVSGISTRRRGDTLPSNQHKASCSRDCSQEAQPFPFIDQRKKSLPGITHSLWPLLLAATRPQLPPTECPAYILTRLIFSWGMPGAAWVLSCSSQCPGWAECEHLHVTAARVTTAKWQSSTLFSVH